MSVDLAIRGYIYTFLGLGETNREPAPTGSKNPVIDDSTSPVQSSQSKFWTEIGPIPNSVGPGLDWTGVDQSSIGSRVRVYFSLYRSFNAEIYLDGTEYIDRTVIISPRVGIQR